MLMSRVEDEGVDLMVKQAVSKGVKKGAGSP